MPVNIGQPEDLSDEEFDELIRVTRKATGNTAIEDLLDRVEAGRRQKVPLPEGQNAKGARIAIKRAATKRGLPVETIEGDGFIVVWEVETPAAKAKQASGDGRRKPGRPRKQELRPDDVDESLQDIATGGDS